MEKKRIPLPSFISFLMLIVAPFCIYYLFPGLPATFIIGLPDGYSNLWEFLKAFVTGTVVADIRICLMCTLIFLILFLVVEPVMRFLYKNSPVRYCWYGVLDLVLLFSTTLSYNQFQQFLNLSLTYFCLLLLYALYLFCAIYDSHFSTILQEKIKDDKYKGLQFFTGIMFVRCGITILHETILCAIALFKPKAKVKSK